MKYQPKKIFLLGMGFFVISLTWPLYNTYVPIFLRKYIGSMTIIGGIMTLDNIAAITLQPYFGARSDQTKTRFGRRMPYLLIGIPLSAVFFALIPLHARFDASESTLAFFGYNFPLALVVMIGIITLFNLSMSIYRAPTVALMPDLTPQKYRSKANGIINFMGGLGAVMALIGGAFLYAISPTIPFLVSSILMLLIVVALYRFINEPPQPSKTNEEKIKITPALFSVFKKENRNVLFVLMAILCWFVGYQGVEATFSNYAVYYLGIKENIAALILGGFSLAFLFMAIPAGWIGTRLGKRKTILIGITGLATLFFVINFLSNATLIAPLLFIGGLFWALININSYPLVTDMTTDDKIGTYTGLYYFFSSVAAISGPLIFGIVIDLVGFEWTFMTGFISFVLAFFFMFKLQDQKTDTSGI